MSHFVLSSYKKETRNLCGVGIGGFGILLCILLANFPSIECWLLIDVTMSDTVPS